MDSYNDTIRSLEAFKGRLTKGISDAKDQIQISEDTIAGLEGKRQEVTDDHYEAVKKEKGRHAMVMNKIDNTKKDALAKLQTTEQQHRNLIQLQEVQIANMEHELTEVNELIEKTKLAASKQGK